MLEIRFHGRGGQGAVTSAEMMAVAAIQKNKYAQAMPAFGAERRGAPVLAFTRIDDSPVEVRQEILEPDIVVVLDPNLLGSIPVAMGLKPTGVLVLNTSKPAAAIRKILDLDGSTRLALVDATKIARELIGRPITNTTMLGALLKADGVLDPEDLVEPLKERFGKIAPRNIEAMNRAYKETKITEGA